MKRLDDSGIVFDSCKVTASCQVSACGFVPTAEFRDVKYLLVVTEDTWFQEIGALLGSRD